MQSTVTHAIEDYLKTIYALTAVNDRASIDLLCGARSKSFRIFHQLDGIFGSPAGTALLLYPLAEFCWKPDGIGSPTAGINWSNYFQRPQPCRAGRFVDRLHHLRSVPAIPD